MWLSNAIKLVTILSPGIMASRRFWLFLSQTYSQPDVLSCQDTVQPDRFKPLFFGGDNRVRGKPFCLTRVIFRPNILPPCNVSQRIRLPSWHDQCLKVRGLAGFLRFFLEPNGDRNVASKPAMRSRDELRKNRNCF
jgi:hypothetical protein